MLACTAVWPYYSRVMGRVRVGKMLACIVVWPYYSRVMGRVRGGKDARMHRSMAVLQ